eukprot:1137720-Pelagomonas_calceolata.AAC.7
MSVSNQIPQNSTPFAQHGKHAFSSQKLELISSSQVKHTGCKKTEAEKPNKVTTDHLSQIGKLSLFDRKTFGHPNL